MAGEQQDRAAQGQGSRLTATGESCSIALIAVEQAEPGTE
jgi:hypothetical protein